MCPKWSSYRIIILNYYQSIIMYHDTFEFKYNPEGGYYDLVIDKKIQQLVDELKELPHDVLIRYLTY